MRLYTTSTTYGDLDQTLDRYVDLHCTEKPEVVIQTLIFEPLRKVVKTRLNIEANTMRVLHGHGYTKHGSLWVAEVDSQNRIKGSHSVQEWISANDDNYTLLAIIACNPQNLPFNTTYSYTISPSNYTSLIEFAVAVNSQQVNISYPSFNL